MRAVGSGVRGGEVGLSSSNGNHVNCDVVIMYRYNVRTHKHVLCLYVLVCKGAYVRKCTCIKAMRVRRNVVERRVVGKCLVCTRISWATNTSNH